MSQNQVKISNESKQMYSSNNVDDLILNVIKNKEDNLLNLNSRSLRVSINHAEILTPEN